MHAKPTHDLAEELQALQRVICTLFPRHKDGLPSRRGRLLLDLIKLVKQKAEVIWTLKCQDVWRSDRHCSVGFALRCDLEILHVYIQKPGVLQTEAIVSVFFGTATAWPLLKIPLIQRELALGMVTPLNAVIEEGRDQHTKANIPGLLEGLPKILVPKEPNMNIIKTAQVGG